MQMWRPKPTAYYIHWRFTKDSLQAHKSEAILTRDIALTEACVLVKWGVYELWIEGPHRKRIEVDKITQFCRDRQSRIDNRVA